MRLLEPFFLIFLATIPVLIILYMIKPKYRKIVVPSIFLWQRVQKNIQKAKPAQRLRTSLLMMLGILILALLSIILSKPVFLVNGPKNEVILAFDVSASMSSLQDNQMTSLAQAKMVAKKLIDSLPNGTRLSVVSFSDTTDVLVRNDTKYQAKKEIDAIKQTYFVGDAKDFVNQIGKIFNIKNSTLYVFSDKNIIPWSPNCKLYRFPKPKNNVSIDNLVCVSKNNQMYAIVNITNRGQKRAELDIELFGDGSLIGAKHIFLSANSSATCYFENIKGRFDIVWAKLNYNDQQREDNVFYTVVKAQSAKLKVLYVGEDNVFFDKAFSAFEDVEYYKTKGYTGSQQDFDIYIFDRYIPQKLPRKGGIILILPKAKKISSFAGIKIGDRFYEGYARFTKSEITRNTEGMEFAVQNACAITDKRFGSVAKIDNHNIIGFGQAFGCPTIIFGFELDDSDLGLSIAFPLLIANIKSILAQKAQVLEKTAFLPGDEIKIYSYGSKMATLKCPDGSKLAVPLAGYTNVLPKQDRLGVYTLLLEGGNVNKDASKFVINFPTYIESSFDEKITSASSFSVANAELEKLQDMVALKDLFLILILFLLIFEWMVFIHENRA